MIILLDESQDMNKKDINKVREYYDKDYFKSMIFISKREDIHITKELKDLIGENKFQVNDLTEKDAVEIIRKRIGGLRFISDHNIIKIFKKNKNPRAFFKNCENIFRYSFEKGAKVIKEEHIRRI